MNDIERYNFWHLEQDAYVRDLKDKQIIDVVLNGPVISITRSSSMEPRRIKFKKISRNK